MTTGDRNAPDDVVRRLAAEADALDHAVYDAVASTPTPTLDVPARWLSKAANYSVLSILIAGVRRTDADVGLFPLGPHRVGLRLRGRGDGGSSSSRVSLVRARNCRGVQPCSHGRALPE